MNGLYVYSIMVAVYDSQRIRSIFPMATLKLEAHSGRGGRLDDPRYVHEHMRGATPPNVYELALRGEDLPRGSSVAPQTCWRR